MPLLDICRRTADQLTSALCFAPFYCNSYSVNFKCVVGADDFVYAVRFATRVELRTGNFVT